MKQLKSFLNQSRDNVVEKWSSGNMFYPSTRDFRHIDYKSGMSFV